MALLDFSKAFDKVPHDRLLFKLKNYGICGKLLDWIKSFLSCRKQRVVLGNHSSNWIEVTSGVPQGSVLGPVLFIIYINDLADCINCPSSIYADDTKMFKTIRENSYIDNTRAFQEDLDKVVIWSRMWGMELNLKKCKIMHFGKKNRKNKYTMLDINSSRITLSSSTSERDLGVILSTNLKSTTQTNRAASKANSMLGLLKRTFNCRDPNLWKKLYTTYIRPQLEFAVAAWNPSLKKDITTLEKVQRRATKVPHLMLIYQR